MNPLWPYYGGKRRIADEVWRRLGDPDNYVEPFFGGGAVLLARSPVDPRRHVETVNDADGLLANTWRAIQHAPEEVIQHADWPVSELDLHARHRWLIERRESLTERLLADPDWCDVRAAGWWLWGISTFFSEGWGRIAYLKRPTLGSKGTGVHAVGWDWQRLRDVSERLRRVRIVCGDWSRVVTRQPLYPSGTSSTAVYLDPPYSVPDRARCYVADDRSVAADVRAWCLEHGSDPRLRIALSGYAGEHDALVAEGWTAVHWSSAGGAGNLGRGRGWRNAAREVVWFSPHCLQEPSLLDAMGAPPHTPSPLDALS